MECPPAGSTTSCRPLGDLLIAVPAGGDMHENAARLDSSGAGLRIPQRLVGGRVLRTAVDRVLRDPGFADRAGEIAAWIAATCGVPLTTDRALAAWRLEDQWVTAVRLTNTTARWLDLDPRALQGDFVAATFQHPTLGPAGQSSDTTVVYLVTRGHGLADSLLPRIGRIDATVNLPPAGAAGKTEGAGDEK